MVCFMAMASHAELLSSHNRNAVLYAASSQCIPLNNLMKKFNGTRNFSLKTRLIQSSENLA